VADTPHVKSASMDEFTANTIIALAIIAILLAPPMSIFRGSEFSLSEKP